tara:strand:+ start:588 stop:740 length:153 start_codon:yes stop_codon:yes gene_type:complete
MDKDEIRAIVDDLLNERDLRMDDLFNQLQLVTKDLELVKRIVEAENEQPQ